MGGCTCSVYERGVPGTYGGRLQWYWCEGANCGKYIAPRQWCNPMNCSNNACYKKGCSAARADFCKNHGYYCPSKKRKICTNESCPGGALPDCTDNRIEANLTGRPLCSSVKPIPTGPGVKPDAPSASKTECQKRLGVDADCCNYGGLGGFGEFFCIQGKSATKGLQAGGVLAGDVANQVGKWMPVILAGFAGLALILVFKQF